MPAGGCSWTGWGSPPPVTAAKDLGHVYSQDHTLINVTDLFELTSKSITVKLPG